MKSIGLYSCKKKEEKKIRGKLNILVQDIYMYNKIPETQTLIFTHFVSLRYSQSCVEKKKKKKKKKTF